MKKYYSALDKRFILMAFTTLIIVVAMFPSMLIINSAYFFGSEIATFAICGLIDVAMIGYLLKLRKSFWYQISENNKLLSIGFNGRLEEIRLKDIKKVIVEEKITAIQKIGFGEDGILIVFENDETLAITPKKKETQQLTAEIKKYMGGTR